MYQLHVLEFVEPILHRRCQLLGTRATMPVGHDGPNCRAASER